MAGLIIPQELPPNSMVGQATPLEELQNIDEASEAIEQDPETLQMLGKLTGEAQGPLPVAPPMHTSYTDMEKAPTAEALFSGIKAVLEAQPGIKTERRFNDLLVHSTFPGDDAPLELVVSYSAQRRLVTVCAALPWAKRASFGLMQLAGSQDFGSTVGIVLHNEEPVYIVKRVIPVSAETRHVLPDSVFEVITEAARAKALIRRYL